MTTILSANGLIEIPEVYRKADALKPGQPCEIERTGQGEYRLHMGTTSPLAPPKERLVDLLLRCPAKGFLVMDAGAETTDGLKSSIFE